MSCKWFDSMRCDHDARAGCLRLCFVLMAAVLFHGEKEQPIGYNMKRR